MHFYILNVSWNEDNLAKQAVYSIAPRCAVITVAIFVRLKRSEYTKK